MALAPNLVRGTNARAMNYVESFITDWEMLEQACEGFPKSRHHIRMCALRLSLRREFVRLARLARRSSSGHRPESRKSKTIHKMLQDSTKADAEQVMLHQQLIQSRRVSAPMLAGSFIQKDSGSGIAATPAAARAIVSAELSIPEDAKGAAGGSTGALAVSAQLASDQAEGIDINLDINPARRPSFNPSDYVAGGGIAAASSAARPLVFDRHLPITISSCPPVVAGAGGARWGNPFTSMVQAAAPYRPPPITEELAQPMTKLAPSATQSSTEGGKQAACVAANASEVPVQSDIAAHMQRLGAVLERLAEEQSRQAETLREVSSAVAGQAGVLQKLVTSGSVSC